METPEWFDISNVPLLCKISSGLKHRDCWNRKFKIEIWYWKR